MYLKIVRSLSNVTYANWVFPHFYSIPKSSTMLKRILSLYFSASGKKLVPIRKSGTSHNAGKSHTLPRIAASGSNTGHRLPVTHKSKVAITPPAYRRQISLTPPGINAGANVASAKGRQSPKHPSTPNRTPTRKISGLRNVDSKLAQNILDEIVEGGAPVTWEDIGKPLRVILCAPF